jgi:hypothetical protein
MNLYDKASLILTPNAYKASKLYSLKPTNGAGDFTFSRASTALRRNSSGIWESVANNVPRLSYPIGVGCPSWLLEPQSTNLFFNSAWVNSGGVPTNWSFGGTGTAAPNGLDSTYDSSLGVTKYLFTATAQQPVLFRSVAVVSGNTYVLSVEIKSYSGTLTYGDVLFAVGAFYSSSTYRLNGSVVSAATTVNQTGILELILVCNASGSSTMRVGSGALFVDKTCTIELSSPQVEIARRRTSPIITPVGSTLTRIADSPTLSSVSSLIGQQEGTILFDYIAGASAEDDLFSYGTSGVNNVALIQAGNGNIQLYIYNNSSLLAIASSITALSNTRYRIVARYKSGDTKIWINGVQVASNTTAFTFTSALENVRLSKVPNFLGAQANLNNSVALFPSLSDAECLALSIIPS